MAVAWLSAWFSSETVENVGGLTPLIGTRLAPTLGAGPPVRVAIPASETPRYRRRMASDWPSDRPPWGVWTDLLALGREGEMKWRVMVELGGAEGTVELHEVSVGGGTTTEFSAETLGLTIAEGNTALAGLQRHLVQAQTEEHCRNRRLCPHCGAQRPLKDIRRRQLRSLYGVVEVHAPRFGPCRCGVASRRTIYSGCGDHARPLHAGI